MSFLLHLVVFAKTPTNTLTRTLSSSNTHHPALDWGAKVHCSPSVLYGGFWKVIRDFFLCHNAWWAGWLQRNAACAGVDAEAGSVCSEADELQARCRAAASEALRQAAVMHHHSVLM